MTTRWMLRTGAAMIVTALVVLVVGLAVVPRLWPGSIVLGAWGLLYLLVGGAAWLDERGRRS